MLNIILGHRLFLDMKREPKILLVRSFKIVSENSYKKYNDNAFYSRIFFPDENILAEYYYYTGSPTHKKDFL